MAKGKTYELMLKIAGKADSSLKAACSAAEKNLASLSNTAKKVAKTVTAVAAAAVIGVTSAASSSLATYSDFQSAMDATAVTARASEEEYAAMSAAARQMGATTTKTATEAAEAMGYMSLAGWNVQQSLTGLEPMLRLSEATSMDLARASDLVTDSMSALGIGVEGMEDYLNLSVQAQRASNTTAEMLMEAFIGCGGAAKTAGVDMGDLSTALGVLANSGTKGAEAGTALNSIIMRMTSKDVATKAMKGLGVSVYNAAGEFRGLETILTDVSAAMSGMSADDKMAALAKIAGTNYSTEMSYLLDAVAQGADGAASAWSALETDIMDHSGVLLEVAKANTDNLKGAAAIFQSAVAELQLQIGEQLAPYAQEALTYLAENVLPAVSAKLGEIIPRLAEGARWALEHRDLILAIAAGVGTAVAAYKTYKTALAAYNAAMGIYKIVTAASATGTFTLAGAMTALNIPVLAACAGIGLLVAGGVLLYRNWDTVKATAAELGAAVSAIWAGIDASVQNAISAIAVRFPLLGAVLQGWWKSVGYAWANIQAVFSNIISFIDNVFAGNWSAALENLIYIFGNLFGGLVNLAKAPINGVVSAINSVLGRINNISVTIPEWVPGVGGKTLGFSLPTIPMLASGGIVTAPTILEAGEGGEPEAILPLSRLAALLDGLSGKDRDPAPGNSGEARPDGFPPSGIPPAAPDGVRPVPPPPSNQGQSIVFSPVLNFYGSAGKKEVEEAVRLSFQEFKKLYRQLQDEERRKSFQRA